MVRKAHDLGVRVEDERRNRREVTVADGDGSHDVLLDQANAALGQANSAARALEITLHNVHILREAPPTDRVGIGHLVVLEINDPDEGKYTLTVSIGTPTDANFSETRRGNPDVISSVSPIGRAVIGHRKGETVTLNAGPDMVSIFIRNIRRSPLLQG